MRTLAELMDRLPQQGRVTWIGVRPAKRAAMAVLDEVEAEAGWGLTGDRFAREGGRRQVTLIQAEHLTAVASMLGRDNLAPELVRRNIVVSGINLLALKGRRFVVGHAVLEHTGLCHPCSRMEDALGAGGYNALRGHGGITARVVTSGRICRSDTVAVALSAETGRTQPEL